MGEKKRRDAAFAAAALAGTTVVQRDDPKAVDSLPRNAFDTAIIEIAYRGAPLSDAVKAAELVAQFAADQPDALVSATVGGWDSDPRELMDIPEAMALYRAFAERLQAIDMADTPPGQVPHLLNRLDHPTRHLCGFALGFIPRSAFNLVPWSDPTIPEQFREDRERVEREKARHAAATREAAKGATKQ